MALNKDIELENGIVTKYHRIVRLDFITNEKTIIEVGSYINENKREEEINALIQAKETGEYPETNIFIETHYIEKEYNENDNIKSCYEYLKTLDEFNKAKDC
jgi:hypothetical protein